MSSQPDGPPPRVRITASRRSAPRHLARPTSEELTDETELGEIYVRGLMRAQLRLSASVLVMGVLLLAALPLIFALLPETRSYRVGPLPLPWLVLGLSAYPVVFVVARSYVRASERLEAAFVDLVGRD